MRHLLRAVMLCALLPFSSNANIYTVTNTNDSGFGSLRQAIIDANNHAGSDSIHFTIGSGGQKTIQPLTPLPLIADSVAIDGTTQPGWTGDPIIEIDGSLVTHPNVVEQNGLTICAASFIRGLIINRFRGSGVGIGAYFEAPGVVPDGTVVRGCWIGVGVDGTTPLINGYDGIVVGANDCLIGGTGANERNIISYNGRNGIAIGRHWGGWQDSNSGHRTRVENNYIGTDVTGMTALGNSLAGIAIYTGSDSVIGGATAAHGNLISGNGGRGVVLSDWGQAGVHVLRNTIAGNRIGVDASGGPLGNGFFAGSFEGVYVVAPETTVASNTIANNSAAGVAVSGTRVAISQNSIYANGALGVDLLSASGIAGVTPNDSGDGDAGPNTSLNYATLTEAINELAHTKVTGSYSGAASQAFTVELYGNVSCDASGHGEGKVYLGAAAFSTNASGAGWFVVAASPQQSVGSAISALVRDASGNTSEFSPCRSVIASAPPSITSISPTQGPYGTSVTISGSGFTWVNGVFFSDGGFTGGISASFTVNSSSTITTTVPTGTMTGPIRVQSPYGVVLSSAFTLTNPSPTITAITPTSGPAAGGTPVTITGTGFLTGANVLIGSAYATNIVVVNSTTITATTAQQYAGEGALNVFNPDGKGAWKYNAFTFYCSPDLSATITAPAMVRPHSTGNTASVPDGGPGVAYVWGVTGGTITSGAGSRTITFTAGATGPVSIQARVDRSDCSAWSMRVVPLIAAGDFNGDGKAEIVWRNSATGALSIWIMDGASLIGGGAPSPGNPGAGWFIAAIADVNGDGKSDLLLRNASTGANAIWLMNGTTWIGGGRPGDIPDLAWKVVGTGDFNGDTKADLVWYDRITGAVSIWMMDGPRLIGGGRPSPGTLPLAWKVAAVADFNRDGKADLFWRNTDTGANAIWFMDGINWIGGVRPGDVTDLAWSVSGSGDMNKDGDVDLVWRNATTGAVSIWLLAGGVLSSGGAPSSGNLGTEWSLASVADFNGDSRTDLLWRNTSTGVNAVWFMDGTTRIGGGRPGTVSDFSWTVIPPR